MLRTEEWQPTKFVLRKGRLTCSLDPTKVGIASRVMASSIAEFYQRVIPRFAKGRLIDLGCGRVPLYSTYKDLVTTITCVDLNPGIHVDGIQDLNKPLDRPDAAFDTVILSDVLEHIRKPEQLLVEIHRILAPDGHLLMNVPFYYGLHEHPYDFFRYTRFALRSMAEDSGFTVVELEHLGGVPEIMADLFSKTVNGARWFGTPLARAAQGFTAWFVRDGYGRSLSQRTGANHPFGYALVLQKRPATP